MSRARDVLRSLLLAGIVSASASEAAVEGPSAAFSTPLAGSLRAMGRPVAGAAVQLRAVSGGVADLIRSIRTDREGTFVWPAALPGVYSVVAVVPGFRPAVARVEHGGATAPTFVTLELQPDPSVLASSPLGEGDPWVARAAAPPDPLRELESTNEPSDAPQVARLLDDPARTALARPLRASLRSLAGVEAGTPRVLSRTSVDLSGRLGERLRWGVEGEYHLLAAQGGVRAGDASAVALEIDSVVPGAPPAPSPDAYSRPPDVSDQRRSSLRLSSRRQSLAGIDTAESRFAAHAVDWTMPTGRTSEASVSARLVSQANLHAGSAGASLFAAASDAFEVLARFRNEFSEGRAVRLSVVYRADVVPEGAASLAREDVRETRVGGGATFRVLDALVVDGGVTGDSSRASKGLTPELKVTLEAAPGAFVYAGAAQRVSREVDTALPISVAGTDEAELTRLSRSAYRAGARVEAGEAASGWVELSRREFSGTFRYILDPDFLDHLDSIYFFPGDVLVQVSGGAAFRLGSAFAARVGARVGRIAGEGSGVGVPANDAVFGAGEAALHVLASKTDVGIGYRQVSQLFLQSASVGRNDLEFFQVSAAQSLPIPLLRSLGSDLRVLVAMELGERSESELERKTDRRFSGGLGVSF